jgi:hypothetical protein
VLYCGSVLFECFATAESALSHKSFSAVAKPANQQEATVATKLAAQVNLYRKETDHVYEHARKQ